MKYIKEFLKQDGVVLAIMVAVSVGIQQEILLQTLTMIIGST